MSEQNKMLPYFCSFFAYKKHSSIYQTHRLQKSSKVVMWFTKNSFRTN